MAEQLSKIETLRSDFIANVSHEFKTPLAKIQGDESAYIAYLFLAPFINDFIMINYQKKKKKII